MPIKPIFMITTLSAVTFFGLGLAYLKSPCWLALCVAAMIAWPIWAYQTESGLLKWRALIEKVFKPESRLRKLLWQGNILITVQTIISFVMSIALLTFAALLSVWDWLVIGLDTLLLAFLYPWLICRLAGEIHIEQAGRVARILLIGNVALLAIGFMLVDFYVGTPDTRMLNWNQVAEHAYREGSGKTNCLLISAAVGAFEVADKLSWHAGQVLVPHIAQSWLKVAVWVFLLLQAGILAYTYSRFVLGVIDIYEQFSRNDAKGTGERSRHFVFVSVVAIALGVLLFTIKSIDLSRAKQQIITCASPLNPCKPDSQMLASKVRAELTEETQKSKLQVSEEIGKLIEMELPQRFIDQQVHDYLDWYYSLSGQYQRVFVSNLMNQDLNKRLFGQDGRKLNALSLAAEGLQNASLQRMAGNADSLGKLSQENFLANPCIHSDVNIEPVKDLTRDVFIAKWSAASGALFGLASIQGISRSAPGKLTSHLGNKPTYSKASQLKSNGVTRWLGKIPGWLAKPFQWLLSLGPAAACPATGPFAPACVAIVAVTSWLAIDGGMLKIDEALHRAEMEAEIQDSIRKIKADLARELTMAHHKAIDSMAAQISGQMDQMFIPARHGI